MGELGFCTAKDIFTFIATRIAEDLPADGGMSLSLTRILHNKILYGLLGSLKCYLTYIDTAHIFRYVSPFLLPFILYFIFSKGSSRIIRFSVILSYPFLLILNPFHLDLGQKILMLQICWIVFASIGCLKMVKKFV